MLEPEALVSLGGTTQLHVSCPINTLQNKFVSSVMGMTRSLPKFVRHYFDFAKCNTVGQWVSKSSSTVTESNSKGRRYLVAWSSFRAIAHVNPEITRRSHRHVRLSWFVILISEHNNYPTTRAGLWHRHCRQTPRVYDVEGAYERWLNIRNTYVSTKISISH